MAQINNSFLLDEVSYQINFYNKLGFGEIVEVDKNTDGHVNGAIFEHKLNITSYGRSKALSQAIIYLSRFNRDGFPVPKNIILVSQEEQKVYIYDSNDYIEIINDIVKYSTLSASKGIEDFIETTKPLLIEYDLNNMSKSLDLINIINESIKNPEYVKITINEHNVYGWSQFFYKTQQKLKKKPKKVEFFAELKEPKGLLKDFIIPWTGKEEDFALIMDLLNDPQQQKKLGAFYTPPLYANKAIELVRKAISQIPEGNDYIILDRCAGTGSLEIGLTDEELSHVIVNTYELKEWYALKDRLGKLVRHIIPPIPVNENEFPDYDDETGFLSGANALDKEFIENEIIMKYVNDPNCNVILLENPPYKDITAKHKTTDEIKPFIYHEYIANGTNHANHRDLVNLFIWSGFKYYLKKAYDSYILLAPVKYFKSNNLIKDNYKFNGGFAFNREYFHASKSVVSCVCWQIVNEKKSLNEIELEAFDIINDEVKFIKNISVKKVNRNLSYYNPEIKKLETDIENKICVDSKGKEILYSGKKTTVHNDDIIGYLRATSYNLSGFSGYLTRIITKDALEQSYGYHLRRDDYLIKLPLFASKAFPEEKWYERDIYFTTSDKGYEFSRDKAFLKRVLIWTALSNKNKSTSFIGSNDYKYKNELCFDGDTEAYKSLKQFFVEGYKLTKEEALLIKEFNSLLLEIKEKDDKGDYIYEEYNEAYSYGIHQINEEINIKVVVGYKSNGEEKTDFKYGDLNNRIKSFNKKVQQYYNNNLIDDLFKYELLK